MERLAVACPWLGGVHATCPARLEIQPQLRPLQHTKSRCGYLQPVLPQAHFGASDMEHVRSLFRRNPLTSHDRANRRIVEFATAHGHVASACKVCGFHA